MNTLAQKWALGLLALGGLYMVLTNPKGFASGADALRRLTAGSVTQIATGGKARVR
jgi:hypothetical protein